VPSQNRHPEFKHSVALAALLLATACSGGGTPTPTTGNQSPAFTSASVVENVTDALIFEAGSAKISKSGWSLRLGCESGICRAVAGEI